MKSMAELMALDPATAEGLAGKVPDLLDALARRCGIEPAALEDLIEPFRLKHGLTKETLWNWLAAYEQDQQLAQAELPALRYPAHMIQMLLGVVEIVGPDWDGRPIHGKRIEFFAVVAFYYWLLDGARDLMLQQRDASAGSN